MKWRVKYTENRKRGEEFFCQMTSQNKMTIHISTRGKSSMNRTENNINDDNTDTKVNLENMKK